MDKVSQDEASRTVEQSAGHKDRLVLPNAPHDQTGPVKAWREAVTMLTYLPSPADPNPLFLEKRVYQGSSGKVYPLPVIDRIDTTPRPHSWQAVHIENEYLRVMVLPELGGRIHVGYDKLSGYDFVYRQNVIKPALVGLAGPWISGGIEFNWPQHHRPATFMPVEVAIERAPDGTITLWCSDHDPVQRMKGMHGVCLRPGCAYLELRVRLYNRTLDTQTFLWWANLATRVHEHYQSFFPDDVRFVADHARRATTQFPQSRGEYYGIPYGERAVHGVPPEETPSKFIPDAAGYPANDLSWYANIPVPTSYMAVHSREDFFGGYDHAAGAGVVHVADHHIAPGKKQWTWGNHEFGYAWDRSLTDADGPYIELMAGVYTDNQPDFSFLAPAETKTFSQYWYPLRAIGVPHAASLHAALRVATETDPSRTTLHLLVTHALSHAELRLTVDGNTTLAWKGAAGPGQTLRVDLPAGLADHPYTLELVSAGQVLLRHAPAETEPAPAPEEATEPPPPEAIASVEELYLIGLHLEQYRHATRSLEPYWQEALRRDPENTQANNALGLAHWRRGEFALAEKHFRTAIRRLTLRNANPYDSGPFYNLGLALLSQDRHAEAYDAFYKSTWSAGWVAPGYHRLAELDVRNGDPARALDHLHHSLRASAENLNALNLRVTALRQLGREQEADAALAAIRQLDPLDSWSRYLATGAPPDDPGQRLDLAFDCIAAGLLRDAEHVLARDPGAMALYTLARLHAQQGETAKSIHAAEQAAAADPTCVFPSRLDELRVLEQTIAANPRDPRAPYYLGNLLYDRRRHTEAITLWERAASLDPSFSTAWRNLGIGYFNVAHDPPRAREAFANARNAAPGDARILYEQDQLRKRLGDEPRQRLATLQDEPDLVARRDDLSVELAGLYNQVGQPAEALALLLGRTFQPWEGGEGLVLGEYTRARLLLGRAALAAHDPEQALRHFTSANNPPESLSEARHLLANNSNVEFRLGEASAANANPAAAHAHWQRAANRRGDFQQMQVRSVSEMTYWSALALRRLGREDEATGLFQSILDYAEELESQTPTIDYFATSLPTMLLFEEDLAARRKITAMFLRAQALLGLGRSDEARKALETVLTLDHAHPDAADLLPDLRSNSRC